MSEETSTLLLLLLDLVGVFAFALSGGLAAVRKRFDLFGVLVLSGAAGLGGGVLRDLLIGATPPVGVSDWRLVTAALAAGVTTFFLHPGIERSRRAVNILDGIGLGFFAVAGTLKALQLGQEPLTAVLVGVLTGVGGGMIRDILSGEAPSILAPSELYAFPAIAGTALFATAWWFDFHPPWLAFACAAVITGMRLGALRWNWQAPTPPGLTR